MSELSLTDPWDLEKERCEQCDGKRPIFANGREMCGVCYGIKKGYYSDPENDPLIETTYERGWTDTEVSEGGANDE